MGIRTLSFLSAVLLWGAGSVQAQDHWGGYYGGISIDSLRTKAGLPGNAVHSYTDRGATLGLFAGYNFVRNNGFVWGPELSLTGVSDAGRRNDPALGGSAFEGGFLLMPRVRVGYVTEAAFFYGIAGFGITDAMVRPAGQSGTDVVISPSFGIGAEIAVGKGWRTKIEVVHHKFDSPKFNFNGNTRASENELTQITLGLSRKF